MKIETFEKAESIVNEIRNYESLVDQLQSEACEKHFDFVIGKNCSPEVLWLHTMMPFDEKVFKQTRLEVIRKYKNEIARLQRELSKIK